MRGLYEYLGYLPDNYQEAHLCHTAGLHQESVISISYLKILSNSLIHIDSKFLIYKHERQIQNRQS